MRKALVVIMAGLLAVLVLLGLRWGQTKGAEPPTVPVVDVPDLGDSRLGKGDYRGLLYGRVTSGNGDIYEGRLRWGGNEESSWGDYFNGFKRENPWAKHVSPERLTESRPLAVFGIEFLRRDRQIDLGRPFVARFGDIVRIEAQGDDLQVTLKSGTRYQLDRRAADDLADGLRVWDRTRGVVDLREGQIRSVELQTTDRAHRVPTRLHGTVSTHDRRFTGFVQWDRQFGLGSDELRGQADGRELSLPFRAVRTIARNSTGSTVLTLLNGREIVLADTSATGQAKRGLYVDDHRYGRVLVSWEAFQRVELSDSASERRAPAYEDFPPGRSLAGMVSTRGGQRYAGRLVYDLDESESTDTLDARLEGVQYSIPFGLIASITLPEAGGPQELGAKVILHSGEALHLERSGDLRDDSAGILVFASGHAEPRYLPWTDLRHIDLDAVPAMYPALGGQ